MELSLHTSTNWQIPHSEIDFGEELGRGSFGKVFRATWRKSEVAVKVLLSENVDLSDFLAEAEVLMKLRPHSNIVQLLGVCSEPFCIICEFMGGGTVRTLLVQKKVNVPLITRVEWLKGIAAGMLHLHEEKIIHRDLAARNILLSADLKTVKVSDFGMSRMVENTNSAFQTNSVIGPIKWMSPELLMNRSVSKMSDVWSYGVLIFEILEGRDPYEGIDVIKLLPQVCKGTITLNTFITPGLLEPKYIQLMDECMQMDPKNRITFKDIADRLEKIPVI